MDVPRVGERPAPLAAEATWAYSPAPFRLPQDEPYLLVYSTAHDIKLGAVPLQEPNTTPQAGVGG